MSAERDGSMMMKVALLSDVHANLNAFEAVLKDIRQHGGADAYWFLGDAVGYGPRPLQCLRRLLEVVGQAPWLAGNHDLGVLKIGQGLDAESETIRNLVGADGALETAIFHVNELKEAHEEPCYHRLSQAVTWRLVEPGIALAHGMVIDGPSASLNVEGGASYLRHEGDAERSLRNLRQQVPDHSLHVLCVGHSHLQTCIFTGNADGARIEWQMLDHRKLAGGRADTRSEIEMSELPFDRGFVVINPGSIGQARGSLHDRPDCRAGYALLTVEEVVRSVSFRRVPYDVAGVQDDMKRFGYPSILIERLALGQ